MFGYVDEQREVRWRQEAGGPVWPLCKLEAGRGKHVAQASVLPFPGIGKPVEVEVRDAQHTVAAFAPRHFVGLDNGVGRALDPPDHSQCVQQVAHKCGLSCAQFTVQFDVAVANIRLRSQRCSKLPGMRLVRPEQAFYNRCMQHSRSLVDGSQLVSRIQTWGLELGFSQIGVSGIDLGSAEPGLAAWLAHGFHGGMAYMQAHGMKRARPAELVPGTVSVLTLRMDYLPRELPPGWQGIEFARLQRPDQGVVSLYARGRDYHKVVRKRLQQLATRIEREVGTLGYRVFTDSAPVLEAELAVRSGQGWRGKHTLVLNREAGSMFFLGEIYLDMALAPTDPASEHCGSCSACIDVCPTAAIVAPYRLDARRCISYLTIEHAGSIPEPMRALIGNRIYGCDDCQLVCPWNKYARRSPLADFDSRSQFDAAPLQTLFAWTEAQFLHHTQGSAIRRIGHERWLRNVAVAMGNSLLHDSDPGMEAALRQRALDASAVVREHVSWALGYHGRRRH
jgi:epoxyqueuosine reductase